MEVGELYNQMQKRVARCHSIRPQMKAKGWRYITGNYEFIKDDKVAVVFDKCISISFSGYLYRTIHLIYFNR